MSDLDQSRLEERVGGLAPAVRFLESTGSTNSDAMRWASQGAPAGALVVADFQTAGRGRLGRSWFGRPGASINMSVVLRPQIGAAEVGLINLAAAVAVTRALRDQQVEAQIKWPNDVLLGELKVCGILAEAEIEGGKPSTVVLGVGINVNLRADEFPSEISQTATSLLATTGRSFDRLEIIAGLLPHFARTYGQLLAESRELLDDYRLLCATLGAQVRIEMSDRIVEGKAVDVDPSGALVLASGESVRVGDVIHVR
jgi:BirA family biotin operon repressor/biotin-[acetyl-CoA-carboxylase] ligase